MSRAFTHVLRVVAGITFTIAFSYFITGMFYEGFFSWDSVITFFTNLKDLCSAGLYMFFYYMPTGANFGLSGLFGTAGPTLFNPGIANINAELLNWYLYLWFSFPEKQVTNAAGEVIATYTINRISDAPRYAGAAFSVLFEDIYSLLFLLMGVIAIVNAIIFIARMRAKNSLNSVMAMAGMVILPLTLIAFQNMLEVFGMQWDLLVQLPNALRPEITEQISEGWAFFTKPIFFSLLLIYLFLELSFQVEYSDLVTRPSEERELRLGYQLEALQRESSRLTTTIEKIQEKVKEKRKEEGVQQNRIKQFFSKAGGFSYIKEMVEKRKFEKSTQKWLEAASDTRRLGTYIDRLTTEDQEARRTLTAKSSAPTAGKMLTSTLRNIAIRSVVIILLTFVVIQSKFIFTNLFTLGGTLTTPIENWAILQSAEIETPESILVLLIPILAAFPISAMIIKTAKRQKLKELLRQEETRRAAAEQSIFRTKKAESAATVSDLPAGTEEKPSQQLEM